ncbi:MAG: DUF1841 family protein [Pseudonocardiaceae bacterium]
MGSTNGGRKRRPRRRHHGAPAGFARPDLEQTFGRLLSAADAAFAELRDPLQVELLISEISAAWSGPFPGDTDTGPHVVIGEGLIAYAERCGTPVALAMLRGLAALGTDRQRAAAGAAADRLAAGGVAEPAWAGELGGLRVTGCWAYGDVYGDQTNVLLGFERGGQRHSVVVAVEHNMGGIATDAFIAGGQEQVLASVAAGVQRRQATLRSISPAQARGIVEAALAATDTVFDPPVSKTYWCTRSLVLARLRALPPAESPFVELAPEQRAGIVADFLASTHGGELADRDAAGRCAELIVEHSCAFDKSRTLRVSPMKSQVFLLAWVPLKAVLSERERDAMPSVVAAWVRWAADRNGLPEWACQELHQAVTELGAKFPAAYADPYRAGPAKTWVAGPGEQVPGFDQMRSVVQRRTFAVPYVGTRIGEKDYPELDASDEQQRWLLIIGEHPEYHEMLGGPEPDFTALIDAVWPQVHLITHEIVVTQLWNDDPPEAWRAAQRLTAAGVGRHEVLHALGEVVTQHLIEGSSAHQRELPHNESYRRDLDALGRSATPLSPHDIDP